MRTIIAKCTVEYTGRLTTHLSSATRLILIKNDGSVAVHCDEKAYKPLNWMSVTNDLTVTETKITAKNRKEQLTINIEKKLSEFYYDLGEEPGLEKDGMEKQIQKLLYDNPTEIQEGFKSLAVEYQTDVGAIDLLCENTEGTMIVIELKRKASIHAVEQVCRYIENMKELHPNKRIEGYLVACSFTKNCRSYAEKKNISVKKINYETLKKNQSQKSGSAFV